VRRSRFVLSYKIQDFLRKVRQTEQFQLHLAPAVPGEGEGLHGKIRRQQLCQRFQRGWAAQGAVQQQKRRPGHISR
jgi:hypothetical protein